MIKFYILAIEDDKNDIALMDFVIKESFPDLKVEYIRDGQSGLDFIETAEFMANPPRLILVDINLPSLSGLQVLKAYREMENVPQIPLVVLSSSDRRDEIEKSYTYGANSYVPKPRDLIEMRLKLGSIISYWLDINKI